MSILIHQDQASERVSLVTTTLKVGDISYGFD